MQETLLIENEMLGLYRQVDKIDIAVVLLTVVTCEILRIFTNLPNLLLLILSISPGGGV